MVTAAIQGELESLADPGHAAILQRFFKTGPGEYGEGDRFRGLRVPVLRKLAKKYGDLPLAAAVSLLQSAFHEDRLLALLILIQRYYPGDAALRGEIHHLYLEHRSLVNNWDLVDASAPHLVGHYLQDRPKGRLIRASVSQPSSGHQPAIIGKTISTAAVLVLAGEFAYLMPLMVKPWGPMFNCTPCCVAYKLMITPLWFCIFRPATPPARVTPAPTAA